LTITYLENDWPNKDKVYYVRGRNYLVLEERDKGIENLNKANELGNSDAKVLLSETKWHSPKLLIETIVLAISNIIICYGTYLLLLAKIYPTPIWLVLLCTIGGVFLFTRCIPFNSFDFGSREILHPYTSKWFQLLEKIILSIVHILVFCILIFAIISCLKSTSNFGSGIIITIILLIFMIIPYLGLRYIWKKS